MNRILKLFILALLGGLTLCLVSCRRNDKPVFPATGKVFFKGKPAEGARVTLVSLTENDPKKPKETRWSLKLTHRGLPADRLVCDQCGEVYETYTPMLCPICSRIFNEETGQCECGAFTGDSCPECGIALEMDDRACRRCGTLFEYVGTPEEIAERTRV